MTKDQDPALPGVYSVFDAAPFAVAVLKGEDLTIEFINEHNLLIWGKARSEVQGKPLFEARPDLITSAAPIHKLVYETGQRFTAEEIPIQLLINGALQTRYYNVTIDPFFDDQRRIIGQLAASLNITNQIVSRQKVEESEKLAKAAKKQLELTVENVPAAVYMFDHTGKVQYINKPGLENIKSILGPLYNAEDDLSEILKKTTIEAEYYDEENQKVDLNRLPTVVALKTGKDSELLIKRVNKRTGNSSWFLSRATALLNEEKHVQLVLATSTDLTKQKLAEEEIREREKRFRTLAEALPQMVWIRNVEGQIEFGSKKWYEYSGIDSVSEAWNRMLHTDDMERVMGLWKEHFQNGRAFRFEARLRNKEGEYRWHQGAGEPVKNDAGKITKWVGVLTDIHAQKTFSENLENLVAERTKSLASTNEDLQQFVHITSHDLKEPVRKILTFTNKLTSDLGCTLEPDSAKYLSKIKKSADRIYSMIDGVLHYSSASTMVSETEEVDLVKIINDIKYDLEVLILERSATIDVGKLPVVRGSRLLLHQLFYNLINNALKFAKPSEPSIVTIRSAIANEEDVTRFNLKGAFIKITIQDNGIGFENSFKEKIFTSFTRLHSKDAFEGVGLGLALCRKVVERHGGVLYADGAEDLGACFTILWPADQLL